MDGLHDVVRVQSVHLRDVEHGAVLGHLGCRVEGTQVAQLHGNALCHEFGQTFGDLHQHTFHDGTSVERAVIGHVLGETTKAQGLLSVHLGIILTIGRRADDLVLSEINPHCNLLSCHN